MLTNKAPFFLKFHFIKQSLIRFSDHSRHPALLIDFSKNPFDTIRLRKSKYNYNFNKIPSNVTGMAGNAKSISGVFMVINGNYRKQWNCQILANTVKCCKYLKILQFFS